MNYQAFKERIKEAADAFRKTDKKDVVRVISHLDADGIAACSILVKALILENRKFSISIVPQLTFETIDELSNENLNIYFFTDIGSGSIDLIAEKLNGKKIFVLDHHITHNSDYSANGVMHLNPSLFGIDGGKEISGAGVTYLFASALNKKCEELAHLAIIGAVGDVQEQDGFRGLNREIAQTAVEKGLIEIGKGLRFFGIYTKPLHKLLKHSDIGFRGEEDIMDFLETLKINYKNGNSIKKFHELNQNDQKTLTSGIILKKVNENPEKIISSHYLLKKEKDGPFKDAREFATVLNSCGRLKKAAIGISACLGDENAKKKAIAVLAEYKTQLSNAISWYRMNKWTENVITEKNYVIINAKENIMATIAGTLCSILSKSGEFNPGIFIMGLAREKDFTKVSLRISGDIDVDLRELMMEIIKKTGEAGGEYGGHKSAAGAIIRKENENIFLDAAKEVLSRFK